MSEDPFLKELRQGHLKSVEVALASKSIMRVLEVFYYCMEELVDFKARLRIGEERQRVIDIELERGERK